MAKIVKRAMLKGARGELEAKNLFQRDPRTKYLRQTLNVM